MPYRVTGQRQTTIVDDSGTLTQVMEVSFRTGKGVRGQIDVPLDQYNAATVDALISAQADEIDKVHSLDTTQ